MTLKNRILFDRNLPNYDTLNFINFPCLLAQSAFFCFLCQKTSKYVFLGGDKAYKNSSLGGQRVVDPSLALAIRQNKREKTLEVA